VSVTAARGFRAGAATAGLKASGKSDIAVVVNDGPQHAAAAVFTTNRCKANPVLWSEQVLSDGRVDAVVLNSGGANCYTGATGFRVTHSSAEHVAALLGASATDIAVCSTGLIGEQLDRDRLLAGIETAHAALTESGGPDAALAIMTTDTHPKEAVVHRDGWAVGGMAKGAGMLAPALATMLVVLTTDADVDAATCDKALREATRQTFDRLDSDGCMSTNDMVLLMASGASGVTPDLDDFVAAMAGVCHDLAMQLLGDAEGSRHDVRIDVVGAASEQDALTVGRCVARSNLLKCAIFGEDPNWGRVLAAVGTTDAAFDPFAIDVAFNGVNVCTAGEPGADRGLVTFDGRDVHIAVDLHAGTESATIWTNDLTVDYVHENSAYST
jgi:glutamate N-acetyltransferase/amino-acid N-acetyltransferase